MRRRRVLQAFSVTILACALGCAPLAVASAHTKTHTKSHTKKSHHKATHHATKTVTTTKGGLDPGSKLCAEAVAGESSSGDIGSNVEKAMASAVTSGNFNAAKQAMIADINASLKEEGSAEAALRSAPANVQAAMKGIFSYAQSFETAINSASSFPQFAASLESLIANSQIETDADTLATYLSAQCGVTIPTAPTTPSSLP
jgi:hypothetical protein